jgi:hypothetical protein
VRQERADLPECTETAERAVRRESTAPTTIERAVRRESTELIERAEAMENTEAFERTDMRKELHALFTRLATIIEEHVDDPGGDLIVGKIEPLIERFIDGYFADVERERITAFLLVWFAQWRVSRGGWSPTIESTNPTERNTP